MWFITLTWSKHYMVLLLNFVSVLFYIIAWYYSCILVFSFSIFLSIFSLWDSNIHRSAYTAAVFIWISGSLTFPCLTLYLFHMFCPRTLGALSSNSHKSLVYISLSLFSLSQVLISEHLSSPLSSHHALCQVSTRAEVCDIC